MSVDGVCVWQNLMLADDTLRPEIMRLPAVHARAHEPPVQLHTLRHEDERGMHGPGAVASGHPLRPCDSPDRHRELGVSSWYQEVHPHTAPVALHVAGVWRRVLMSLLVHSHLVHESRVAGELDTQQD